MFNSRLVTANFEKLSTYLMSKNKIYNKCHALTNGPPETSRENFIAARQDASWNVKKKNVKYNLKVVSEYLRFFSFSQLLWNDTFDLLI